MDRRRTSRLVLPPGERPPVSVTLLSPDGQSDVSHLALLADCSDDGIRLLLPHAIPAGTPVRVELPDRLALGHACYCLPQPDSHFAVGVRVSQILDGLSSLRRLAARLMGEPSPRSVSQP